MQNPTFDFLLFQQNRHTNYFRKSFQNVKSDGQISVGSTLVWADDSYDCVTNTGETVGNNTNVAIRLYYVRSHPTPLHYHNLHQFATVNTNKKLQLILQSLVEFPPSSGATHSMRTSPVRNYIIHPAKTARQYLDRLVSPQSDVPVPKPPGRLPKGAPCLLRASLAPRRPLKNNNTHRQPLFRTPNSTLYKQFIGRKQPPGSNVRSPNRTEPNALPAGGAAHL